MRTGQILELNIGESATYSIVIKAKNRSGQAISVDLTDKELWFYVKRNEQDLDENAYIIKSIGNGIDVIDGPNGVAELNFYSEDTSGLLDENMTINFGWSLRLKYGTANGTVIRHLQEGTLVVTPA
jgi:hypothetical protein